MSISALSYDGCRYRKAASNSGLIVCFDANSSLMQVFFSVMKTADKSQRQYAFLNYKGENPFNRYFSEAKRFINEYAMVVVDGKDAVINTKGDVFFCADFVNK